MLPLIPAGASRTPLKVLCLGAHSDDIEIGCGGTLLELLRSARRLSVHWVVFSGTPIRAREARASATRFLRGASRREVQVLDFRDGFLPYQGSALKETFEVLKASVVPDLVFTHWRLDAHQDHRLIGELTWNTFRDHLILEYEVPKYDGDLGHPNLFVPLSAQVRARKVRSLLSGFPSQRKKRWFSAATFDGLMRLRGIESGVEEGYAEAFHVRKGVLRPSPARR